MQYDINVKFSPTYCNGQCTLIEKEAAHKIHQAATQTNRQNFRIEGLIVTKWLLQNNILHLDVYYSGILRQKAGIPLDDEDRLAEMHCTYLDEELYRWKYKNLMKTKNLTLLYHESTY